MSSVTNRLNGRILTSSASESYNAEGLKIPEGRYRTRITLSADLDDKRIYIAALNLFTGPDFFSTTCRKIIEWCTLHAYVTLKLNEKENVLTHVRSLSSRLHLSTDKIFEKVQKGKMEQWIVNHSSRTLKTITAFQKTVKNYTHSDGILISKKVTELSLAAKALMEVYKKVFLARNLNYVKSFESEIPYGSDIYYVKAKPKKVRLFNLSNREQIGEGASSQVFKVADVSEGVFCAFKCPHQPDFEEHILEEGRLSKRLNPNNAVPGLLKASCIFKKNPSVAYPLCVGDMFDIANGDKKITWGDCHDKSWDDIPVHEKLYLSFHILLAFYYLNRFGLCQTDHKMENILFDNQNLYMIDLETVIRLEDLSITGRIPLLPFLNPITHEVDIIFSRNTFPFTDFRHFRNCIENQGTDERFRELIQKFTVFSMGATLCEIVADLPYELRVPDPFPNEETISFDRFPELGIPPSLCKFFASMLSLDPDERPKIDDIPKLYLKAFKKSNDEEIRSHLPQMRKMLADLDDLISKILGNIEL